TPTPYDNAGSQDHNQVLGADVTHEPELTNSVRYGAGPFAAARPFTGARPARPARTVPVRPVR
ncbi:hypothetical protein ACFWA5_41640, partial [Streptomyces mirabilis]|uniref:hypothetical protein n=1 Tax=Streptomyces mirabilis TaxID=68239 RepID=UPI003647A656